MIYEAIDGSIVSKIATVISMVKPRETSHATIENPDT